LSTDKQRVPVPEGMTWIPLSRELLESDAWRSMGINERRLIDFLLLEHLCHGMRENGNLKAPYEHLKVFGIGARYIADTIRRCEELGLTRCRRNGLKIATTFSITWLNLHDGSAPSNDWRQFKNPNLRPVKIKNLPHKGKVELPHKGKVDRSKSPKSASQREGRLPKNLPHKGNVLSRVSYQGSDTYSDGRGRGAGVAGRGTSGRA
jgi:hypothetical protein